MPAPLRTPLSGSGCNLFWQVGSQATLGTGTAFLGNVIALSSITLNTAANTAGRLLARNGAVTLDSNVVAPCSSAAAGCPSITLQPLTLPPARIGFPQNLSLQAGGGVAPYSFSVIADSLPPGMSLSNAGLLSGTPSLAGSYAFSVRSADANGCLTVRRYTLQVAAALAAEIPAQVIPTLPPLGLLLLGGLLSLTAWIVLRR